MAADPAVDERRAKRWQRHTLPAQPAEHRVTLDRVDVTGAQLSLAQPEHREPELARQAHTAKQRLLKLATHAAVQLPRVDVVGGGHRSDGQPTRRPRCRLAGGAGKDHGVRDGEGGRVIGGAHGAGG